MKKIKIFLASSDDLAKESLELSDLVEHLNLILEKQDIHIYLAKWDYIDSKDAGKHYEETLDECDLSLVIFGNDFGSYTEAELRKVYERVCKERANPQKLYVYFRAGEGQTEALKKFRDSFPDQFGHFTGSFVNENTLRADFMLQFQLFQSENNINAYCEIKVKNGKVYLNEQELFINMMKVPFMGNNERYTELLDDIEDLREWLDDHNSAHKNYAEKAEKLRKKEERKEKMESSLWDTAIQITRLSNQRCSERLKQAIELLNQGNNEGARAILDTAEIDRDAEKYSKDIKQLRRNIEREQELLGEKIEGLKSIIEEYKLRIKTLENDMLPRWREEIVDLHNKVMERTKEAFGENSKEYIDALLDAGRMFSTLGHYERALTLEESALKLSLSLFGEKHQFTATSYNNMGLTYSKLGKYDKALEYGLKALKIFEELLGEKHPDTAQSYDNVGCTYGELGNYDKELEYKLKALKIREELLGEKHPDTAQSYNNVGYTYDNLGNYDKELEYKLKALKIFEELLGEKHPDTATSYDNVGYTYGKLGKHEKALEYKLKALKIFEELLGERHPDTAVSYDNVSFTYEELGEYEKAVEYRTKAVEISKALGNKDGEGFQLTRLGKIYAKMGDKENAKAALMEALTLLPEDHPDAIDARKQLEEL